MGNTSDSPDLGAVVNGASVLLKAFPIDANPRLQIDVAPQGHWFLKLYLDNETLTTANQEMCELESIPGILDLAPYLSLGVPG